MSIKFVWDESYSVGNEVIDSQHRRLFDLGNEIQNIQLSEVTKTIMKLYKHTREHFDTEEQHMKVIGYPKLEQHRELHNDLISGLNDLVKKPINTDVGFESFKKFVYDWIIDHILNHDKKYFEFYQEKAQISSVTPAKINRKRPRKYQ
jgi:hemerythrin